MSDEPAAFHGVSSKAGTMADGTLRIQVDIAPQYAIDAFRAFGAPGSAVALARLTDATALEIGREELEPKPERKYGNLAQMLKRSSFFRHPAVWAEVGSDEEFLYWIRRQPCAVTGKFNEFIDGEGFSVAAHVRRAGESGTAHKPEYSAIPLLDELHKKQHQEGESSIAPQSWWDKERIRYVSDWCWFSLKAQLGYDSWAEIPPKELFQWAVEHSIAQYLPPGYAPQNGSEEHESTSTGQGR